MAKKKGTSKRRKQRTIVDYVLVVEDEEGQQLAVVLETDCSRAPLVGEEVPLRPESVEEAPQLAGTYVVHRVAHLAAPGSAVTIERYTVPWCYARRRPQLASFNGEIDRATAAELAQRSRDLATDLDDLADEVALAIHAGAAGSLDLRVVERLNDASRRAKQVSISTLVRSRTTKSPE